MRPDYHGLAGTDQSCQPDRRQRHQQGSADRAMFGSGGEIVRASTQPNHQENLSRSRWKLSHPVIFEKSIVTTGTENNLTKACFHISQFCGVGMMHLLYLEIFRSIFNSFQHLVKISHNIHPPFVGRTGKARLGVVLNLSNTNAAKRFSMLAGETPAK